MDAYTTALVGRGHHGPSRPWTDFKSVGPGPAVGAVGSTPSRSRQVYTGVEVALDFCVQGHSFSRLPPNCRHSLRLPLRFRGPHSLCEVLSCVSLERGYRVAVDVHCHRDRGMTRCLLVRRRIRPLISCCSYSSLTSRQQINNAMSVKPGLPCSVFLNVVVVSILRATVVLIQPIGDE